MGEGTRLTSASVPYAINDEDKRVLLYYVRPPDGRTTHTENTACATSENGLHFTPAAAFKIAGMRAMKACDRDHATSTDGITWKPTGHLSIQGADPGAVATRDGGWLLLLTGPTCDQRLRE